MMLSKRFAFNVSKKTYQVLKYIRNEPLSASELSKVFKLGGKNDFFREMQENKLITYKDGQVAITEVGIKVHDFISWYLSVRFE